MYRSRDEVAELVVLGLDVLSEKDPKLFDACCLVRRVDAAIEAILEGNESQLLEMIEQSGDKMLNAKSLR